MRFGRTLIFQAHGQEQFIPTYCLWCYKYEFMNEEYTEWIAQAFHFFIKMLWFTQSYAFDLLINITSSKNRAHLDY